MLRLLLLVPLLVAFGPPRSPVREPPPVQTGQLAQTDLADWLKGTLKGVYVEGGDLRLQEGEPAGSYESQPVQAPFGLNAAILQWHARATTGQTLTLELRSSADGQTWSAWQAATPRPAPGGSTLSELFVLPPLSSWLQYRARLESVAGSPSLADVTVIYLNSTAGPALVDIAARVPPSGPPTLTPPPLTVAGVDWGARVPGPEVERQRPRRIAISQLRAPADDPNSAATIRALQWVAANLLRQEVLPYHFLIDGGGTIYQGASSAMVRLDRAREGTVKIALLADVENQGLSAPAAAALAELLAWLGDMADVEPAAVQVAPDAPRRLHELLPELRAAMDQAIVRSRMYFAAATTSLGTEQLSLLNPGPEAADVILEAVSPGLERRSLTIPAGQRVDVALDAAFPTNNPLALTIMANRHIEAERVQSAGHELLGGPAIRTAARAWYFGEGSGTDAEQTALEIFNPQERDGEAVLTLFPDSGDVISRTVALAAESRQTILLDEMLPGQHFAFKVVATQPIVAERAAVAENGAAYLSAGSSELSRRWLFAEGSTLAGYTTTLALLNPWPQQIAATVRVLSEDGTSLPRRYALPAQGSMVVELNDFVPDLPFAMDVIAERPIVAERVIRFDEGRAATASLGSPRPATRWTFVEGSTAIPNEEYLLVVNPSAQPQPVDLEVAYLLGDGSVERRTHTVGANSRLTISANADVPGQPVLSAIITAERPIVAERTIYTNAPEGRGGETSLGIPSD